MKQFRVSIFYTLVKKNGASSVTLLAGHDTPLVTAPSQLTPSLLSWLETGDIRMLTTRRLDSYLKRCLTSGEPQHQVQ